MIRKARLKDIKTVHALISHFSQKGQVIPRALGELYEHVREFFVYETEEGLVAGACALHIVWEDLGEIRSLVVREEFQGSGIGAELVRACLREAKELGLEKVFVLTVAPEFFEKLGFEEVEKGSLPHKVWADCIKCPKFPECDEVAMIKEV